MLGSWIEIGDILVGKLTPQIASESLYAPEDRLLRAILGIQGQGKIGNLWIIQGTVQGNGSLAPDFHIKEMRGK
ncbi:hypothetical protein IEQ34_021811 [Dendrobium chrysotoxum]|uniref:Uncharacterized protein n=1 Tax=Dendrobium chrysotoxum TaxID=161865 RepID=A0AAV7FW09_DENCH|nr:hypothetical protein IEQ34_021811 [Dendrobium chrysotoxum]